MFILGFVVNTNEFAKTVRNFEKNLNHIEVNKPKACFSKAKNI